MKQIKKIVKDIFYVSKLTKTKNKSDYWDRSYFVTTNGHYGCNNNCLVCEFYHW